MNLNQFTDQLLINGPHLERWPPTLRDSAKVLVAEDPEAATMLARELKLAQLLDELPVPEMPELEQRVLRQPLPPQSGSALNSLLGWLLPPDISQQWWRPALAATVPLVFGIVLGNFFSFGVVSVQEVEYWEEEIYLLSLADYPDQ